MLRVRQESVAGHEYARLNIGASITRENSENGALHIREGEQARKQRVRLAKTVHQMRLLGDFSHAHAYEVRPRKDHRGVNLISDALPSGRLWYEQAPDPVESRSFFSRSHDAVIRVYDEAGNVIETHEHAGRVVKNLH